MARNPRKRLSWFKFYVDDFVGGTWQLPSRSVGQYLRALSAQWQTKDVQAISSDPKSLRLIFGGERPDPVVLEKFALVDVGGRKMLRNERLAEEWVAASREVEGKARGGGRKPDVGEVTAPHSGSYTRARPRSPDTRSYGESEIPLEATLSPNEPETDITTREPERALSIWLAVLARLEETVPPHNYATWLRPTRAVGMTKHPDTAEAVLVVEVPGGEHRAHIWATYGARLRRAVEEFAGEGVVLWIKVAS